MTAPLLYFAFGSNLLSTRLLRRCPGAGFRSLAAAPGHRVIFDKLSEDSSGKANLVGAQAGATALGVVYTIPAAEIPALDAFEGPGYARIDDFPVACLDTHDVLRTITYVARRNVSGLRPFDWYLALVLAGMHERAMNPDYIQAFGSAPFVVDPEPSRATRLNAMRDLAEAGYDEYSDLLNRNR
jgi:gamma-glutamylcyclotransferase